MTLHSCFFIKECHIFILPWVLQNMQSSLHQVLMQQTQSVQTQCIPKKRFVLDQFLGDKLWALGLSYLTKVLSCMGELQPHCMVYANNVIYSKYLFLLTWVSGPCCISFNSGTRLDTEQLRSGTQSAPCLCDWSLTKNLVFKAQVSFLIGSISYMLSYVIAGRIKCWL